MGGDWESRFVPGIVLFATLGLGVLWAAGGATARDDDWRDAQRVEVADTHAATGPLPARAAREPADLCELMRGAGAREFGHRGLVISADLRARSAANVHLRQRRCSFHALAAARGDDQDLFVSLSTIEVPRQAFEDQFESLRRIGGRTSWREHGRAGFGWMRADTRELELHYLLASGRQLKVRWSGGGVDPEEDLAALRALAGRVAASLD